MTINTLPLTLYNSATKQKAPFTPLDAQRVRMYVCGPTVYDHAHIGNARPAVVFDLLFRMLRFMYGAAAVVYARNYTDIDDKIIIRAREENVPIDHLTNRMIAAYESMSAALGLLTPTHTPRATQAIADIVAVIERLIAKGHAYEAQGHVLFDVASDAHYGSLSNRSLDEQIQGARVEVAPYKRNAHDFVLWKPSTDDMPSWPSPWGNGRPGWHIECSAMSRQILGEHFDIHGGGIDLLFPHHENERAQSCCAFDTPYVNVWMHNGFLLSNGQKMSKSLGNFLTVYDLLHTQHLAGDVIRLTLLRTHYRQPCDWTDANVRESTALLAKWRRLATGFSGTTPDPAFMAALADDLNMPAALAVLNQLTGDALAGTLHFLGFATQSSSHTITPHDLDLLQQRNDARARRDFATADALRQQLLDRGLSIVDSAEGSTLKPK